MSQRHTSLPITTLSKKLRHYSKHTGHCYYEIPRTYLLLTPKISITQQGKPHRVELFTNKEILSIFRYIQHNEIKEGFILSKILLNSK